MWSIIRKNHLNIAMLSYHTCPLAILGGKDTGGMNVYVRELTRFLGQINVHVDVFTRSQDDHVPHVLHDLGYSNRVVHINAGPEIPLPKKELVKYIPDFYGGIRDFAKQKGIHYDLIHSHYWMSGIAAGFLQEEWHVPVIHMFHTLGYMKNTIARHVDEIEGPYRMKGEQKVMDLADKIIAATPAEVKQLTTHYHVDQDKITVIPPGVDCSHFYPIPKDEAKAVIGIPPESRMILFVGRIEPLKGVETLLRAISIMREECNLEECPYHVAIIGGETNEQQSETDSELFRLKSLCHDLGLDETVIFLGKRDQNTLPYYYSAAEMLVMPSYYESFGMVALESMACGTPVVASNIGGLAYLVQDGVTGFTVSGRNDKALARRLSQLLFDQELQLNIGKQAAEYTLSYSWEIITAKIKSMYEELMQKESGIN
jgi:D-inositol-3-phosphate glycosyltransferase